MTDDEVDETQREMLAAVRQVMPFGKYAGRQLLDLPEYYLVWFKQRGFPAGRLGAQMALIYEIKLNGLERVFRPLLAPAVSTKKARKDVLDNDSPTST